MTTPLKTRIVENAGENVNERALFETEILYLIRILGCKKNCDHSYITLTNERRAQRIRSFIMSP